MTQEMDGPEAFRWCHWCKEAVPTTEWRYAPQYQGDGVRIRAVLIHTGIARWCLDEPPGVCGYRDAIPEKIR